MDDEMLLPAAEAAEYGEFKRTRRETEISFTLRRLLIDASGRECDRGALKKACDTAVRLRASGVLVSPVNVVRAKRTLGVGVNVCCLVGGTGESLISVKKTEAKKALRQGAREIRLIPCRSALAGGNYSYLKREIKRVRRAAKRRALTVSLEDHGLTAQEISLGVKAACAARANGVCVRGEPALVMQAVDAGNGKLFVEASGVENSEQLLTLLKAGAARASTALGEKITEELYTSLKTNEVPEE